MLWDDVVDESTPEKLFFSRAFEWVQGKWKGGNRGGYNFHMFLNEPVYTDEIKYHSIFTINSWEYKGYKRSGFYKSLDATEETLATLEILIKSIGEKFRANPLGFLKKYNEHQEYNPFNFVSYEAFNSRVCGLEEDEVIKEIDLADGDISRSNRKIDFINGKFKDYIVNPPISDSNLASRRNNLHHFDKEGERNLNALEREANAFFKDLHRANREASRRIMQTAGFPYLPTIADYKRFLLTNIPSISAYTSLGTAKIKTADILSMKIT